ncbi:MAG: peroxiredoxin [Propionibacteriaceae bacterium]|nr:peroxiredoxin [Propionibacteriaceae bacterium]
MAELVQGDQAPDFRLQDAQENWVSLSDYAGGKLILYFYPKAMTPGCTIEAVDFSASVDAFAQAGYSIAGVSPDKPASLMRFMERNDLTIKLLSDPEMECITPYGAWGDKTLWGKVINGLIRSTFIIDVDSHGKGKILEAEYGVRATGHVERLRTHLGIS